MAAFFVSDDLKCLNRDAIASPTLKGQPPASRKQPDAELLSDNFHEHAIAVARAVAIGARS